MSYLLIIFSSLLSCAGQLCQKQAMCGVPHGSPRRHLLRWLTLALLCLGLALLLWLVVLSRVAVSVAYPMLSLNYVLVLLAARFIWHERLNWRHIIGITLIMAGIILLGVNA
ncbi:4-amino-4-deoxy-L-arabinose-phosphoundecaprenol flippase subunit ArnE [Edwardsiella piscicida]|uniref:Probable 4-amino-4-deoxy-L-arabinose-phosphoundecaprenol flippase subunit ArnE n=3 Tax=Edwardsiella TaxID=635 RepID=A0A0H3DPK4_EDWTF|nr:4-amino-4-deoxy-L-arabinose-phosphoundecaprenol flippase subunit ArnE [Edwardsiella piscicida]ACY84139.1 sucrose-6 phosphate hydrolase [Edwardsiella tarda EIB202]ADM41324.1 Polymyxin resistance protein PmrL [Edwardsiella tarda FL6-60]AGH73354.1 Polymyxin resistance protein PmrL [Edwardsiella piscicida C07-087]AOP42668.1 4-amino-4-deoxy-L-arabinose-phosphoundecaprenol flippase subunit ArnE [Edwardsiella piscicida]ARD17135.1 4-amino-4-deoxy-L-arabinose-phospho-UDP flippase [Edwardsiella pisci